MRDQYKASNQAADAGLHAALVGADRLFVDKDEFFVHFTDIQPEDKYRRLAESDVVESDSHV